MDPQASTLTAPTVTDVPPPGARTVSVTDVAPQQPTFQVREPAAASDPQQPADRDAIERARQQEREKLYGRLSDSDARLAAMDAELKTLKEEREARLKLEAEAEAARVEAEKQKELKETSAKELLVRQQEEWNKRFSDLQAEREVERETLRKEAEFNALRAYTQERVRESANDIDPRLIEFIKGNTEDEINASVEAMKAKTAEIFSEIQEAQVHQRSQMRGVSPTAIPGAAIDDGSAIRTLTAQDVKNMTMAEYGKYRKQLLGAAASTNKNRGLFD